MQQTPHDDLIQHVDRSTITRIARLALSDSTAELADWHHQPMRGELDVVSRISGIAVRGGGRASWSAILKRSRGRVSVGDPHGGIREPIIYGSNYIQNLPCRIAIPRCLAVTRRSDEPDWIWIEDIVEDDPGSWTIDRFKEAAFRLGEFNAVTMDGSSRPDWPWIDGPTNLREFVVSFSVDDAKLAAGISFWRERLGLNRACPIPANPYGDGS